MRNIINDIREHTPPHLEGHYYIKTQKIYVPFSKINIHGIEKDIFELGPFFLGVMQLAAKGITKLENIADILGIADNVFSEAVTDMAHIDYVSLSEGNIYLTNKGKKALAQNERVVRKNIDMQNVFVDLITGQVHDADITYTNPRGRYVPLVLVVNIDNDYFSEHFKEIRNLHKLRQKQYQINENAPIEKELEKITGYEQSIVYIEKELYIYKNIGSEDLQYKFNDDDAEGSYLTQFFKLFNQELINGNQRFFFGMNNKNSKFVPCFSPDPELLKQTENLRKVILSSTSNDEKEEAFWQRHYALNDSEYVSFITNSSRFSNFDYIIIICHDNPNTLFSDSYCSQLIALSKKIPVFIVYESGEDKRNMDSINYFFPEEGCGEKLYLLPEENLNKKIGKQESCICYYPKMTVNITTYTSVTEFGGKDSPRRIAYSSQIYDFDKKMIEATARKIIELFPEIQQHLEDASSKKSISQNIISKNGKSTVYSDYSKSKNSRDYGMKHSKRHKDKQ